MSVLVDLGTLFSLASVDENTLRSYIYSRLVTFVPIGFESLYPSVVQVNGLLGLGKEIRTERRLEAIP